MGSNPAVDDVSTAFRGSRAVFSVLVPNIVEVDADLSIDRDRFDEKFLRNKIVAGNAREEEVMAYVSRGDMETLYSELQSWTGILS